jgi:hypothetical protein
MQGSLAVWHVIGASGGHPQTLLQERAQGGGREHANVRRRQLQRQWQTVQAAADLRDIVGIGGGQGKVGSNRPGPLHKERHRLRCADLLGRDRCGCHRQSQRIDVEDLLDRQP